MGSPASPIADLTYRNYDGPLETASHPWWAIAKMSMRLAIKKKSFWVLAALSGWWYLILSFVFYFVDIFNPSPTAQAQFFKTIVWKDQFLDAFSRSQHFLLLIALLIGVGTIANDNKANALLVYLSKPCTKADYLIGKWFGIFIPLLCVVAVPTLFFFGYCAMSYRQYGIISDDPWLILKLIALFPIAPAFHASVSLGISSLFDQGRMAGSVYAGLYFMSYIFTVAVGIARVASHNTSQIVTTAFYCSIDGLQIAFAKIFLGTGGSNLFKPRKGPIMAPPDIPSAPIFIFLYVAICALALSIAWSRIRAVEVVGS